jgi:hypothetical protein
LRHVKIYYLKTKLPRTKRRPPIKRAINPYNFFSFGSSVPKAFIAATQPKTNSTNISQFILVLLKPVKTFSPRLKPVEVVEINHGGLRA